MIYLIPLFAVLFFAAFAGFFVFVFYLVLSSFYRTWEEARNNDRQPIETLPVRVVAKRLNASGHDHVSTWYYLTFEFQSGERREFVVSGKEYGMIAEGDQGLVTYQGTRYHQFLREPPLKGR